MNAKIVSNEIAVQHAVRPDVGLEFLTIECPNGWDDVKKLTKKVLLFDGRRFTFCSWNSDRNVCNFNRRIDADPAIARIL